MLTLALVLAVWLCASVIVVGVLSLVFQGRSRFNPQTTSAPSALTRRLDSSSAVPARRAA